MESVQRVARVVKDEEHRYATTFLVAEKVFNDEIKKLAGQAIPGAVAFKLYDTFGLALDEQEEMARERGLTHRSRRLSTREMEQQRERARASWKGAEKGAVVPAYQELLEQGRTKFLGYANWKPPRAWSGCWWTSSWWSGSRRAPRPNWCSTRRRSMPKPAARWAITACCYSLRPARRSRTWRRRIPAFPGLTVHRIVTARADRRWAMCCAPKWPRRCATPRMRNHTGDASAARRAAAGAGHARQAGRQRGGAARLRFDFTHYAAMDRAELAEVERLVNEQILRNTAVDTDVMPLDQAIATGAMALFGEKYGDQVRVVSMPGFSKELCGGTHVRRTGDIGVCKIVYEGSISAGVRRIEAITGEGALRQYQETSGALRADRGDGAGVASRNWSSRWRSCWPTRRRWRSRSSSSRTSWRRRRSGSAGSAGAQRRRA